MIADASGAEDFPSAGGWCTVMAAEAIGNIGGGTMVKARRLPTR